MLKKKVLVLGMLITLLGAQLKPRPAHAIAGFASANPALAMAGAMVLGHTGAIEFFALGGWCIGACNHGWKSGEKESLLAILGVGALALITGIVLLDGGDQALPAFAPITGPAPRLGTSAELEIYNHELDELNAARESVIADANALIARGGKFGIKQSATLWDAHRAELSPETRRVAGRIVQQAFAPKR
jgi:hypothetical protein